MNSCKDCKHWGEIDRDMPTHRHCPRITDKVTTLGSYQLPPLATPPEFGCVLFDWRDEETMMRRINEERDE